MWYENFKSEKSLKELNLIHSVGGQDTSPTKHSYRTFASSNTKMMWETPFFIDDEIAFMKSMI